MRKLATTALAAILIAAPGALSAHDGRRHAIRVVGPADAYIFPLAEPGSYDLPAIGAAADAVLLDDGGERVRLADVYRGGVTVLAFIYTRCGDICPLVSVRMSEIAALAGEGGIGDALTLVSLSFDPEYDTPEQLARYGRAFRTEADGEPRWLFLTAPDVATIAPVLEDYSQPVARKTDAASVTGAFAHLLRVFLIDGAGDIRNIYSADFLDPRLILNDVRSLLLERRTAEN